MQVKQGFRAIGYINNNSTYLNDIRRLCGDMVSYQEIDQFVSQQWAQKETACPCWDKDLQPTLSSNGDACYFIINTGYVTQDSGIPIYGGFSTTRPSALGEGSWSGVLIGTERDILDQWGSQNTGLMQYTYMRDDWFGNIARVLNRLSGEELSEEHWKRQLDEDYRKAAGQDAIGVFEANNSFSYFRLSSNTIDGQPLWAVMDVNRRAGAHQKWYGLGICTQMSLLDRILDTHCYRLGYFHFENARVMNVFLEELAEYTMDEPWSLSTPGLYPYSVLRNYLEHTLYHLLYEDRSAAPDTPKKVDEVNGKLYFNSGLLNHFFRQIIIMGNKEEWTVDIPVIGEHTFVMLGSPRFFSDQDVEITNVYDGAVYKVPAIAKYFTDYREVMFNAQLPISLNDSHIFEDGVERGRLPKYQQEYEQVKDDPGKKALLCARIARDFSSAIERARLLAERNYKLAIPQYWMETNEIQYLLPIYLGEREENGRPECALALRLVQTGRAPYYRGATILTLDMAYNNARLLAKPDVFWLDTETRPEPHPSNISK